MWLSTEENRDPDPQQLIDGYFDETLAEDQHEVLCHWIKANPEHARIFAEASLLHDRLRNTLAMDDGSTAIDQSSATETAQGWFGGTWLTGSMGRTTVAITVLFVGLGWLWLSMGTPHASAAMRELDRIIVNSMRSKDRTYQIVVEEIATDSRGTRSVRPETQRPPKPPLDGAMLFVGSGSRFVLIRQTPEGLPFVTGCNGRQSWAVNTRGPVKFSFDIHRFDHDLPGHETSVPLANLHEGLQQLKSAYDLTFSALGPEEYRSEAGHEARLLIAVKKPKVRGPQRVEIVYDSTTGAILRMRFVQMPYGPDRLDLRMSLISEEELASDFFEHATHHAPDRKIELEN